MDSIAPLIHAFYSSHVTQGERQSLHLRLLESLSSDACISAADAHISHCSASLSSSPPPSSPPDPLVLHYSLHALENRIRTSFLTTPPEARAALLDHLLTFTVAAFAYNATSPATALSTHVITKSARTAVELGKRQWVANTTSTFPQTVLSLIDQNGHTASSLPRIYSGMALLTILVDDALDVSRADVRAADRLALNMRIASIADAVVAALEVGLRIGGPGLLPDVPAAAVRTVGSIMRVAPSSAPAAMRLLRRRTDGRQCCDVVGAEALGVLAEVYGESHIAVREAWEDVLGHLARILDPVAMGEVGDGTGEVAQVFRKRLTGYASAVFFRAIASEGRSAAMERALNGFMGATMRWAREAPEAFPAAIDVWVGMLEVLEDAGVQVSELLKTAYGALTTLCAERCMFATNAGVLRALDVEDEEDDDATGEAVKMNGKTVELIVEMASRPVIYAGMAARLGGGDEEVVDEDGEVGYASCNKYVEKCVEGLVAVARLLPASLGVNSAELAARTMSKQLPSSASEAREAVFDKMTALTLARLVAPVLPPDSETSRMLVSAVAGLFGQSPLCLNSGNLTSPGSENWHWKPKLDVGLLNLAAVLSPTISSPAWGEGASLAQSFVQACRGILVRTEPNISRVPTLLLLLSLGESCRATLFASEPPLLAPVVAASEHIDVAAMGLVGALRWTIECAGANRAGGRGEISDAAWAPWISCFQQFCGIVFSDFMTACSMEGLAMDVSAVRVMLKGACLSRALLSSMYSESRGCKNVMWAAIGRELGTKMLDGLRELCQMPFSGLGDDDARLLRSAKATLIGSLGCLMRVYRRHIASEAPRLAQDVISVGLEAAKRDRSPHLARALLTILREQVGDGFSKEKEHLVPPAVELACQSMEAGDSDVTIGAVGVLVETLTRHWLLFWPGDVVAAPGGSTGGNASDAIRKVYFAAFGGLLTAVRHSDASVSREGMLGLERVEASRKLYSRTGAFRAIGGGSAVIAACIGAMWNSALVADEACAVVWGVGKSEWNDFYGASGSLMNAIASIQACSEEQVKELVQGFLNPTDRPTFTRALVALVNDLRFTSAMNKGPSL